MLIGAGCFAVFVLSQDKEQDNSSESQVDTQDEDNDQDDIKDGQEDTSSGDEDADKENEENVSEIDNYEEWATYEAGGLSFRYPKSWEVERNDFTGDNFQVSFSDSEGYSLNLVFNPPAGSDFCIYSDNSEQKSAFPNYIEYDNFIEFKNEKHTFRRSLSIDRMTYGVCEKVENQYEDSFNSAVLDYGNQLIWATYTLPTVNADQEKVDLMDLILLSSTKL